MTIRRKINSIGLPLVVTLRDGAGAVDLSTASTVKITITNKATGTKKVDLASCSFSTVTSGATKGQVSFAPGSSDFNTAGTYYVEFKVTWANGKSDYWPADESVYITLILEPTL